MYRRQGSDDMSNVTGHDAATDRPAMIAYLRVSTAKQGASGLGLEAQRARVQEEAARRNADIVAEYIETESGSHDDRPQLHAAIADARKRKGVLIVAKLDRLARNVRLLLEIADSGVDPVFCDLPELPPGPAGRFMLTQLAAVAEFERGLISERTKAALKAVKARGVKLGNPTGDTSQATATRQAKAAQRHADVLPVIREIQAAGVTSMRGIAKALNARGIKPLRKGGAWSHVAVLRVLTSTGHPSISCTPK